MLLFIWKIMIVVSQEKFSMRSAAILLTALFFCSVLLLIGFDRFTLNAKKNLYSKDFNYPEIKQPAHIKEIEVPDGYQRIQAIQGSFAAWLQNISLRKDNIIYLYNGTPKEDQQQHYAVLDISTGNKDLQQCADCIMRLQSEYYFSQKTLDKISFPAGNGIALNFADYALGKRYQFQNDKLYTYSPAGIKANDSHENLLQYLETVYNYCGTYTLQQIARQIQVNDVQPGDILLHAGSPGHAMIVVDMAIKINSKQKIFLLAQGFMPAQDMHIVINPNNDNLSPWYALKEYESIQTPGWLFYKNEWRRFVNR